MASVTSMLCDDLCDTSAVACASVIGTYSYSGAAQLAPVSVPTGLSAAVAANSSVGEQSVVSFTARSMLFPCDGVHAARKSVDHDQQNDTVQPSYLPPSSTTMAADSNTEEFGAAPTPHAVCGPRTTRTGSLSWVYDDTLDLECSISNVDSSNSSFSPSWTADATEMGPWIYYAAVRL
ncbi:hypothetical protein BASA62_009868 [Batrachochytrium salamandrivorans]|nr:hypothetical protein BASA62_009868 [Batrachochytrium salamandrivorans]